MPAFRKTYDPDVFSEDSARWAIDFVDNLLYLRWQDAIKDLQEVRDPLEAGFFEEQAKIDAQALKLYEKNKDEALNFLTSYTRGCMEKTVQMYKDLRNLLISKYTNNKLGL
jgi:dipeptidase